MFGTVLLMRKILVCAVLAASCGAVSLLNSANDGKRMVVHMTNLNELSFAANISIGGQPVPFIMDTGSFQVVAFREGCTGCPSSASTFFNPERASARVTDKPYEFHYGSGTVLANASFATMEAEAKHGRRLQAKDQLFWLAQEVHLYFEMDASFGGVFGLGPPASGLRFMQQTMREAYEVWNQDQLDQLQEAIALERNGTRFLGSVSNSLFSICLLQGLASPGKLILNDPEVIDRWVSVRPGGYWEVEVSHITVGDDELSNDEKQCSAIVDSGTSLIGMPYDAYDKIVARVDELSDQHGCIDLLEWPQLEVKVGDQTLSLPPTSYVGQVDDDWDHFGDSTAERLFNEGGHIAMMDILDQYMPHIVRNRAKNKTEDVRFGTQSTFTCQALVFRMDFQKTPCQFLFGLPLFRTYYVSHKLNASSGVGISMAFSKGNARCTGLETDEDKRPSLASLPLTVNPLKIRFPTLLEHSLHLGVRLS